MFLYPQVRLSLCPLVCLPLSAPSLSVFVLMRCYLWSVDHFHLAWHIVLSHIFMMFEVRS